MSVAAPLLANDCALEALHAKSNLPDCDSHAWLPASGLNRVIDYGATLSFIFSILHTACGLILKVASLRVLLMLCSSDWHAGFRSI